MMAKYLRRVSAFAGMGCGLVMMSGCDAQTLDPDVYLNAFLQVLGSTLVFLLDNALVGLR